MQRNVSCIAAGAVQLRLGAVPVVYEPTSIPPWARHQVLFIWPNLHRLATDLCLCEGVSSISRICKAAYTEQLTKKNSLVNISLPDIL